MKDVIECPFCGSRKPARVIRYFQPRLMKCVVCNKNFLDYYYYRKKINAQIKTQKELINNKISKVINMRERASINIKRAQKIANEQKKSQKIQIGSKIYVVEPN